jgi:multimeric flavodoxin WrbA
MKILALIGSPRKGGNTDLLVDQILKGSKTKGHTAEKLYLYKYKITPCIDCRNCKKGDHVCTLKDGMQQIYPKMTEADLIIFGTPVYYYGPTGQMKLLIDRMRPYGEPETLKGKKGVIVAPSAEGAKCCGPLIKMLRMSFDYLGIEYAGKVLGTAYEKGEILQDKQEMNKAYKLGMSLSG